MRKNKNTNNFIKYAKTYYKSFDEDPFNEVDSLIFSWLIYLRIHENFDNEFSNEGMDLSLINDEKYFDEMLSNIEWKEDTLQLILETVKNPRYSGAKIKYFRFEDDISTSLQFCAMTVCFKEDFNYVVFRGTDGTVHGWKENMMLLMHKAAPSQMMAVNYLNSVAVKIDGPIIVGGHSKGGNLAVYASAHCSKEIRDRISDVYSHDGPGFPQIELDYSGMKEIKDRIHKTIPNESFVGLFLKNECTPKFVASSNKGMIQHYSGSWIIDENKFEEAEFKNTFTQKLVKNINKWAEAVDDVRIALVMNTLFEILEASGSDDFQKLFSKSNKNIKFFVNEFKKIPAKDRKKFVENLKQAFSGKVEKVENKDLEEFGIDWDKVDTMMNELETKEFNEKFDLFI